MGEVERPGCWDGGAPRGTQQGLAATTIKLGQVLASSHSTSNGQPQGWVRQWGWATLCSDRAVTEQGQQHGPSQDTAQHLPPGKRAARGDGQSQCPV